MTFHHLFQEPCFVTSIVNQDWFLDGFKDGKEFPPNLPLVLNGARPQAVLEGGLAVADAQADKVAEITVGQALDIQIDGRDRRRG